MPYPTKRTKAVEEEILERMSKGEPLAAICRSDPKFPSTVQWNAWCRQDEALRIAHDKARDAGEEVLLAECLGIADDASNDWMLSNAKDNPGWKLNGEHVQRSKLRIETRLKLLAKWNPRKWGDKTTIGSDPENPLPTPVANIDVTSLAKALRIAKAAPAAEPEDGKDVL